MTKRRWTQHRNSSVVALHVRSPTTYSPSSPLQICGVEGLDRVALDELEEADVWEARLRFPRQPASTNGATTPEFSAPFPSQCVGAAHAGSRATRLVAVRPRSLRDASPGSESSPPGRLSGRRPFLVPPLSGGRRPLTHSPRREVVSGPATQRVPTPRLLGDMLWQLGRSLFGMPTLGTLGAHSLFLHRCHPR